MHSGTYILIVYTFVIGTLSSKNNAVVWYYLLVHYASGFKSYSRIGQVTFNGMIPFGVSHTNLLLENCLSYSKVMLENLMCEGTISYISLYILTQKDQFVLYIYTIVKKFRVIAQCNFQNCFDPSEKQDINELEALFLRMNMR